MRPTQGFSLAELILAIGTLAACILTVLVMVVALTRSSRKTVDTSVAQQAAEQVLTRIVYDAQWNDHVNFWYTPDHTPYRQGTHTVNRTEYSYQLDASTIEDTASNAIGAQLNMNRIKMVTLRLSWWGGETQNRAGYGKLNLEVKRVVHEKPLAP